ncbi:MAG TPA: CDP-alcohol phosphatidyltransferase family protein [Vicinamibacteria bacterium]
MEAKITLEQPPQGLVPFLRAVAIALSRAVAGIFGFARDTIARGIIRVGIPPNAVTLAGPVVMSLVFIPVHAGNQRLAGLVLIAAGAFDLLDGAVARISRGSTNFGGFLDSVVDRYTDFIMLFAILVHTNRHVSSHRLLYFTLWSLAVVGTATTPYVRARAETVVDQCKVGFMERAERTVTIIIGALAGNLHITLWILAIFTNLIAVQRIFYARLRLNAREPRGRGGRFWLWMYPRLTAPHFTLCALLILSLIIGHLVIPRPQ